MDNHKYGMKPLKTRREYEHNFFLLAEDTNRKVESGNDQLIRNVLLATYPHIKDIRNLPNRRLNLITTNEQSLLQANMKKWMELIPAKI